MKLLMAFVDGMKPEAVEHMEFLSGFSEKRRMRTELGGYSPACHASMYTGVYTKKHLNWFTWKYSPGTSPFRTLGRLGLDRLPQNTYTKYLYYRTSLLIDRISNPFVFGFTTFVDYPIGTWKCFDTEMKRPFTEPGLLNGYPNIFDILKRNAKPYEIVGLDSCKASESYRAIDAHAFTNPVEFSYLFFGDIDPLSHRYGSDAPETVERLREIDRVLRRKYEESAKANADLYFMIYSDHGHVPVESVVDMREIFRRNGENLTRYIHFMDANHARFWFRDEKEKATVGRILSGIDDKGFVYSEDYMKECNAEMPDNRYGDIIYYLDRPHIFKSRDISVLGRKAAKTPVSMHGYLPEYPDCDAVVVANKRLREGVPILQDIAPSILDALGMERPDHMDGRSLWLG